MSRVLTNNNKKRTELRRMLLCCEDDRSAADYLKCLRSRLRLPKPRLQILGNRECGGGAPQVLLSHGNRYNKRFGPYEHLGCVFDRDNNLQALSDCARIDANVSPVGMGILTDPCFEFWLLLHYEYTTGINSPADMLTKLRRHVPGYDKTITQASFDQYFWPLINVAISNAERLRAHNLRSREQRPMTNFDRLIAKIYEYALESDQTLQLGT